MLNVQLTVPGPDSVANPNTITDPQALEQWIGTLPRTNPAGESMALLKALTLLNRHPGGVPQRRSLMLGLLGPSEHLLATLRERSGAMFGSRRGAETQRLAEAVSRISMEMAYGFKRLVNECVLPEGAITDPALQAGLIYHAMHQLALTIILDYSVYRIPPRTAWREILHLYLLAKQLKVSREPVTSLGRSAGNEPETTNIGLEFKRTLLLSLLDPYKLHVGEIWMAYDYLAHWAQPVQLGKPWPKGKAQGWFVLDSLGLEKPRALQLEDAALQDRHRYLSASIGPLNEQVHRQMKELQANMELAIPGLAGVKATRALQLFRHMLLGWHVIPRRQHDRLERYEWLNTACGLDAAHHFVQLGGLSTAVPAPEDEATAEEDGADETLDDAVEEVVILAPAEPGEHSPAIKVDGFPRYRWRQINRSEGGVALHLAPEDAKSLHVGQIVLLEGETRTSTTGCCRLGVVRRMISRGPTLLEAGLQFVTGEAQAVTALPVGDALLREPQPAILVDLGDEQPRVLLTTQYMFRPGGEYDLDLGEGGAMRHRAGRLLEASCCFERFELLPAPQPPAQEQEPAPLEAEAESETEATAE